MALSKRIPVRIFGQKRCGTNLLEWLVKERLPEAEPLVNAAYWKHGPASLAPAEDGRECVALIITKCPEYWYYSNERYLCNNEEQWDIHGYVERAEAYLAFAAAHPDHVVHLLYEELILQPWSVALELQRLLELRESPDLGQLPEARMGTDGKPLPAIGNFDPIWVERRKWLDVLKEEEIAAVRKAVEGSAIAGLYDRFWRTQAPLTSFEVDYGRF